MRTEVRNQITMLGNAVATEVPGRKTHRRWMRLDPVEGWIELIEVEVPVEAHPTDWPKHEDEYVIVARESFDSLDAALDSVRQRGINTDSFDGNLEVGQPVLRDDRYSAVEGGWGAAGR